MLHNNTHKQQPNIDKAIYYTTYSGGISKALHSRLFHGQGNICVDFFKLILLS